MWGSFCDLAMAGGPLHKGALLGPGRESAIDGDFDRYDEGPKKLPRHPAGPVCGLRRHRTRAGGACHAGRCDGRVAAARHRHGERRRPAAGRDARPARRAAVPPRKEIQNVITVVAKTCHYWVGHVPRAQQQAIGELFLRMDDEAPLVEPALPAAAPAPRRRGALAGVIARGTGLRRGGAATAGWLGVECGSVRAAVSMMRALVASNVLARREATMLCVPVNPATDPGAARGSHRHPRLPVRLGARRVVGTLGGAEAAPYDLLLGVSAATSCAGDPFRSPRRCLRSDRCRRSGPGTVTASGLVNVRGRRR